VTDIRHLTIELADGSLYVLLDDVYAWQADLLRVADAALTEFITDKGSDFDRHEYPAHGELRALLTTEAILAILE
jgi:hypothetical protein